MKSYLLGKWLFLFYFDEMYVCFNGKIMPADEPVFLASNRGYRYGDGLFETMKLANAILLLEQLHFERLFAGLELLKFEIPKLFVKEKLISEVFNLAKKNNCIESARVRLSVFRGNGGLYDEEKLLQYLIECWPLNKSVNRLNENGFIIDVFPDAKKSTDIFSGLKSSNFLPYTMAAQYAKENKLNDCLVLNTAGNIADATIANVFLIKGGTINTPAANQGCVLGVMRGYLLEKMRAAGYDIKETNIAISDIDNADEIFLSNAVNGIRWVKRFRDKVYTNTKTVEIYNQFVRTISL